jgi:hypothetical protein
MPQNTIIALIKHRHKFLDLIYEYKTGDVFAGTKG